MSKGSIALFLKGGDGSYPSEPSEVCGVSDKYYIRAEVSIMMVDLRGEEVPCTKGKQPSKMNGFEAFTDIHGGFACQCPKCKKERGC